MLSKLKAELNSLANPKQAEILQRFFKTGKGQYGEGDVFLGIKVPVQRKVAKNYKELSLEDIQELLDSEIHEYRMVGLFILIDKYKKDKGKVFEFYLKNSKKVNNWDLVDLSAPNIVGDFLLDKNKDILYKLATNPGLYKDKQLFDKVYELSPGDILSHNPNVFEQKDIINKILDSNVVLDQQILTTNSAIIKYPEIMQKLLDIPNRDIHSNLFETICHANIKARREGQKEKDIPDYIKDIHKKLYYKLYPEQYVYEEMHR